MFSMQLMFGFLMIGSCAAAADVLNFQLDCQNTMRGGEKKRGRVFSFEAKGNSKFNSHLRLTKENKNNWFSEKQYHVSKIEFDSNDWSEVNEIKLSGSTDKKSDEIDTIYTLFFDKNKKNQKIYTTNYQTINNRHTCNFVYKKHFIHALVLLKEELLKPVDFVTKMKRMRSGNTKPTMETADEKFRTVFKHELVLRRLQAKNKRLKRMLENKKQEQKRMLEQKEQERIAKKQEQKRMVEQKEQERIAEKIKRDQDLLAFVKEQQRLQQAQRRREKEAERFVKQQQAEGHQLDSPELL